MLPGTARCRLKVVAPYDAADAKGLLKAAIRDPNPVVFLEHEMMYGHEFEVPDDPDWLVPIGKAKVRRVGDGVTLVAYSRMVDFALKAADELAKDGIEAEVVDLRTIRPMDWQTVVDSVRKTNRLVTIEEGWGPMGVGAEIAAKVVEHAFDDLDAPPMRVHQEDVPLPLCGQLGGAFPAVGGQDRQSRQGRVLPMSEAATPVIQFADFERVDVRVGTVVEAQPFPEARKPAIKLVIDFGPELGRRKSSAQIVANHRPEELIGRQVLAVVNFPPRQIGPFMSEVLTLGLPDADGQVMLIGPDRPVPAGGRLY